MGSNLIGSIINTGFQLGGAIGNSINTKKTTRKLNNLIEEDPEYGGSPWVKNMYGLAQQRLNGRMTGAAAAERNIYGSQANAMSNINRLSTDSSQALALAAAAQAQTNSGFDQLRQQEGADYNQKYAMLNDASQGMTEEERFKYGENVRRWQDRVNNVMTQYKMRRAGNNDWSQVGAGLAGADFGGKGGDDTTNKIMQMFGGLPANFFR